MNDRVEKLKNRGRRVLALLCSITMMLPMAVMPAEAVQDTEGVTSADITSEVLNGQLPIFKWTALENTSDITTGMHYVIALTEDNTVWRNTNVSQLKEKFANDYGGMGYATDGNRGFMGNRKYSSSGHKGDFFYTVGYGINPIIINWDGTSKDGSDPMIRVFSTKESKPSKEYDDTVTNAELKAEKVRTTLYALKINSGLNLENTYDGYNNAKSDAERNNNGVAITDLFQKVAKQRSGGADPLAAVSSLGSQFSLRLESGLEGTFKFVNNRGGGKQDAALVFGNTRKGFKADDTDKWHKVWCEKERDNQARFNLWEGEVTMYSTLTQSYRVSSGQTLSLHAKEGFDGVYIPSEIKLVVDPGGTLAIDEKVYNDGTIINNGGTIIVQKEGRLSNLATDGKNEIIVKDGDFIIMPGGAVYTNADHPMVMANSRLINFGYFMMGGNLMLYSSFLENRKGGVIAGNLRFGNNTRYRYVLPQMEGGKIKKDTNGRIVYNENCWIDYDSVTGVFLDSKGLSSEQKTMLDDESLVDYADIIFSDARKDGPLLTERKDWTPYFGDFTADDLKCLQKAECTAPEHMVDYSSVSQSKIYVYDTSEHYGKYGCLSMDDKSYIDFIDLTNTESGIVKQYVDDENDLKNMISRTVTDEMLANVATVTPKQTPSTDVTATSTDVTATPTDTLASPTDALVTMMTPPVTLTNPTDSSTDTPTEPTDTPTEPTDTPTEPTDTPTEPPDYPMIQ